LKWFMILFHNLTFGVIFNNLFEGITNQNNWVSVRIK